MTLIKFEPLRELGNLQHTIHKCFGDFPNAGFNFHESFSPRVDISEDENNVKVVAEIPGVKKDNLKITLQDNILTIEGEKKKEEEKKEKNFYRSERIHGSFKRCFTLPVEVDSENVEAKFDDGILNITLHKLQQKHEKEKVIEVK